MNKLLITLCASSLVFNSYAGLIMSKECKEKVIRDTTNQLTIIYKLNSSLEQHKRYLNLMENKFLWSNKEKQARVSSEDLTQLYVLKQLRISDLDNLKKLNSVTRTLGQTNTCVFRRIFQYEQDLLFKMSNQFSNDDDRESSQEIYNHLQHSSICLEKMAALVKENEKPLAAAFKGAYMEAREYMAGVDIESIYKQITETN